MSIAINFLLATTAMADGYYERILDCDNGAAVVDRHLVSPRYPQLVIRNTQIVAYLVSQGVAADERNEVILTGPNDQPVFRGSDFHGFLDRSGADWVRREGSGIRVSFNHYQDVANSDCGIDIPLDSPICQPQLREVANWYFQKCE